MSDLDLTAALQTFSQEAQELLDEMESSLLALEDTPDDSEMVNSLFRAMHTIKGSSGLFGFDVVVAFTHEAETILDMVRNGEKNIDDQLISVLLDCKDHTSSLLDHCTDSSGEPLPTELQSISDDLIMKLTGKSTGKEGVELVSQHTSAQNSEADSDFSDAWLISLDFKTDAFRMGVDPLSFLRYLKTLGEIQAVLLLTPDMPKSDDFDPESCYLSYKIAFKTDADKVVAQAFCNLHGLWKA